MAQYTNTNNTLTRGIVSKMPPTFIESSAHYSLFCFDKEETYMVSPTTWQHLSLCLPELRNKVVQAFIPFCHIQS